MNTKPAKDMEIQGPVAEAISQYLRRCSSGGMPKKEVETVMAAVEDAERLGYFAPAKSLFTTNDAEAAVQRIMSAAERHERSSALGPVQRWNELAAIIRDELSRAPAAPADAEWLPAMRDTNLKQPSVEADPAYWYQHGYSWGWNDCLRRIAEERARKSNQKGD